MWMIVLRKEGVGVYLQEQHDLIITKRIERLSESADGSAHDIGDDQCSGEELVIHFQQRLYC